MLDRQAEIDAQDKKGQTALMMAAFTGNYSCVNILLDKNADINKQDNNGATALIMSLSVGRPDVAKILLDAQAAVDTQDNNGATALMMAAKYSLDDVIKLLLNKGANIDIKDKNGLTALEYTAENTTAFKALLHNGAKYIYKYTKFSNLLQQEIDQYASQQDKQTITCFTLALLASTAIAAIGVLALFSISCHWIICLAVAIVSCSSSSVFMALLCKQNAQRQTIDATHEHTLLHRFLLGLISIAPAACVVFHMLPVSCPPLLLVAIGIMSISLLSNSFYTRIPHKIPGMSSVMELD